MTTRAQQLELINLATQYLAKNKPTSVRDYRMLKNESIFKGICYGMHKNGLTDADIEKEVCSVLKLTPMSQQKAEGVNRVKESIKYPELAQYDGIQQYIFNFKPEEIHKLPRDKGIKVLKSWLLIQKGANKRRMNDFDAAYFEAMKSINMHVLQNAKAESIEYEKKKEAASTNTDDNNTTATETSPIDE